MKERKITKTALLIGISVLLILAVLAVTLIVGREDNKKKETPLGTYWTEDSAAAQSLREYVAKVTDPADKDSFIPVKDRIAVFDMDGTLTCETYYTYYDTMMFIEYCLHDHPAGVPGGREPGAEFRQSLCRNDGGRVQQLCYGIREEGDRQLYQHAVYRQFLPPDDGAGEIPV